MDLFPLYNSIRIAIISTIIIFFVSLFVVNLMIIVSKFIKGILDVIFTLPLVLPPTVVGYLLLRILGLKRVIGKFFINYFNLRLTMNWWSAIFATSVIIFPLIYRTLKSSFEAYDNIYSECSYDLGESQKQTFWKIKMPICKEGIAAGLILSFERALGEYGATSMICGYTPLKTATIATTVYQLWRTDNDGLAFTWVFINILISTVVLLFLNYYDKKYKK